MIAATDRSPTQINIVLKDAQIKQNLGMLALNEHDPAEAGSWIFKARVFKVRVFKTQRFKPSRFKTIAQR